VDEEHVRWLERLSEAAQKSIDDLRDADEHDHTSMIRSLEEFRERILAKLHEEHSRIHHGPASDTR
jgi:hypothetical protein